MLPIIFAVLLVSDFGLYALPSAMLVVSLIIGSGGLAMFMKYNTRLAIMERDVPKNSEEIKSQGKDMSATTQRVSMLEGAITEIRDALKGLNVVHTINSSVEVMKARLEDNQKATSEVKQDLQVFMQSITKERVTAARKALKRNKR